MEVSEITIKLMFDKIESFEKEIRKELSSLREELSSKNIEIIALKEKVRTLEKQLNEKESSVSGATSPAQQPAGKRDTTKYMLNGNVYLKNRLVLAIVRDYADRHPDITRQTLKTVFDKTLQGSIGVVENSEIAEQRPDCTVRFFTRPEEVITLSDGKMYVCTQWGILNIPRFLTRARQLGYKIEEIK